MDITQCIAPEMARFEAAFHRILHSSVPLATDVVRYFLDRRGKQLRPRIVLLAAKMYGAEVSEATVQAAVAIELLHNASLIHDDVVDASDRRRGHATVNEVWDNRVAVLVGDFFLSKCLAASNATGSLAVSHVLASIVTRLAEGELEQLAGVRSHTLSEEAYMSVISGKTASLFAACMEVGALTAGAPEAERQRAAAIGERMGLIFQMRDDIFDYYPADARLGKPTGHDIIEGKATLPLLYALRQAQPDEAQRMRALLTGESAPTAAQAAELAAFAQSMGGIDYTLAKMKSLACETRALLAACPEGTPRDALTALVGYLIDRRS